MASVTVHDTPDSAAVTDSANHGMKPILLSALASPTMPPIHIMPSQAPFSVRTSFQLRTFVISMTVTPSSAAIVALTCVYCEVLQSSRAPMKMQLMIFSSRDIGPISCSFLLAMTCACGVCRISGG